MNNMISTMQQMSSVHCIFFTMSCKHDKVTVLTGLSFIDILILSKNISIDDQKYSGNARK